MFKFKYMDNEFNPYVEEEVHKLNLPTYIVGVEKSVLKDEDFINFLIDKYWDYKSLSGQDRIDVMLLNKTVKTMNLKDKLEYLQKKNCFVDSLTNYFSNDPRVEIVTSCSFRKWDPRKAYFRFETNGDMKLSSNQLRKLEIDPYVLIDDEKVDVVKIPYGVEVEVFYVQVGKEKILKIKY